MKIVFLTSGSTHHWYFVNYLKSKNIDFDFILSETEKISPKFEVLSELEKKIENFEKKRWKEMINIDFKKIKYPKNINNHESINIIKKIKPDLGIVFGTRKIEIKIFKLFKYGLINIHRGITQEYRGIDCELWPIYHSDLTNIGVTIHLIDKQLDTGEIIKQKKIKKNKTLKCFKLRALTTELAADLVYDFLKSFFRTKKIKSFPQIKKGRYYSFMPKSIKGILEEKLKKSLQK